MKTRTPLFRIDPLLIATLALLAAPQVHAQTTNTWQGANGGAWLTAASWSPASVPTSTVVARFTNTDTRGVGINMNTTSTNNAAGFLFLSNGTVTISNSSTGVSANNSNSILRVSGWLQDGQTNLIVNSSASGHLIFTNHGSATATIGLLRFTLSSGGVINVSNSGARVSLMSLVRDFSGTTNTITKTGAGTLIIGGTNINTWAGGLVLNAGVLQLNKSSALGSVSGLGLTINGGSLDNGSGGAITLSNYAQTWGGNFTFIGTTDLNLGAGAVNLTGTRTVTVTANALTVGGTITNTGGITKAGAGTLILNGDNTYSGTTTVNAGTLSLGNTNALQNSILDTGTSGSQVVTFGVAGNNTYNVGALQGSDALAIGANTLSVGAGGGSTAYSGAISGSGGALSKIGSGTLTLSANSSYTGATTIGAGLLAYDGTNTSTAVTIHNGGTLGGSGSVGAVTVNSGGIIAPGNSPGTLSVSSLTLNGGGSYSWELTDANGAAGTGWDVINVGSGSGVVTLGAASGNQFTINVIGSSPSNFTASSSYTWDIIDAGSWSTSFAANAFLINTNNFSATGTLGAWSVQDSSGNLRLVYTAPVAPPSSSTYVWNTTDGAWSVGGNWTNTTAPTNGSALIFAGASGGASTNDSQVNDIMGVTFSNTAGSYTLSGSAFTNSAAGIVNNSASAQTISNDITLGAAQSFNAASGDLTFAGAINNNANLLTVSGASNTVVSGAISGSGGLTKSGAGSLTLGANNTFTGTLAANSGTTLLNGTQDTTTVNVGSGILLLGGNDRLANGATLTLSSGTLNFGGFTDTVTTFNVSGGVFTNGTATATIYGLSGGTIAGNLGTGTINVTGSTALNGTANAGTINVNSGTLTLGSASRLTGTTPAVTVASGGTLALGGAESVGSIAGAGAINLGAFTLTAGGANTSTTFSGAISGSGGLTKAGNATLTLTGANTYTGTTTVSAGELSVSNNSSSSVDIASGATFSMKAVQTLTSLSGLGTLSMGSSALTYNSSTNSTFGGVVSGTAALTKSGLGTLTLNGVNTFTGAINANGGVLSVDNDSELGDSANDIVFGAGTLQSTASFAMGAGRDISGTGTLDIAAGTSLTNSGTVNMTSLTFANTGTLVMAGSAKTNNAITFSAGGVLSNTGTAAVIGGNVTANNTSGTAVMAGAYNLGSVSRTFTVTDGSAAVDMQLAGDLTLSGGSAFLIKAGTGRLEINGVNTASSGLQIGSAGAAAAGQVLIGNKDAVGTNTLRINSGTLEASTALTGANALTNLLSIGGRAANAAIIGGTNAIEFTGPVSWFGLVSTASTLQVNNEAIFSGVISNGNANGVTFEFGGTGTMTLSGLSANLFTNALTISNTGLTVVAAKNGAFGTTAAGTTVQSGSTIVLSNVTYSTTEALTISGTGVGGNGALRGAGTSSFAGTVTAGGATTIAADSGAALTLSGNVNGGGNAVTFAGAGNSTVSGIISNGTLVKSGVGTLTLSGANTYSGGTLVSGGVLLGDTRSLQNSITNDSAIVFNQSTNGTYGSVMSGSGTVTKSGSGTVTFSQNNTYNGATTVSGGRLVVNGSQGSSSVTVDNGASLGGTGTVGGLAVNGLLAPGNSIGTLTAGDTTFNGGGSFQLEIFDWVNTPGTGWDLLSVTGDLALSNTALSPFTINLVSLVNSSTTGLSTDWNQNLSFTNTFITYSGSLLGNSFASDLFSVNTSGFQNPVNGTFSITNVTGGLALLYTTAFVPASDYTWSAGSGVWSSGGNWTNGSTPENGNSIIFAGPGGTSENDAVVSSILGLTFSNTAGSYDVSGTALAIGAGGIANQSTAVQTISNNLSLSSASTVTASNGDLVFAGNITNGSNAVSFTGAKNTTVSGAISGSGSLAKDGAGTLTLTGANSYAGGTTVSAGRLVGDSTSLQGGIANSAAVTFNQATNGTYAGILSGTGSLSKQGAGTLLLSASNSYSGGSTIDAGTVQINGANGLGATAGALTINNGELQLTTASLSSGRNIVLGHANSAIEVDAGLRYTATNTSVISGSGTLNKLGTGTLALYGTNTYSGGNVIAAGTLEGDTASLQGAISNNGAVSFLQATNGTYGSEISGTGSLTKTGNGTLTLAGANSYSGGTLLSAGALSGSTASLQGAITNNATIVMSQATNGTYSGALSGAGAFTKAGSGTVTLEGNNIGYNGTINLQAGGLIAGHNNALGANAVTLTNGSVVANGGLTIANNFTIGAAGGSEVYYSQNFNDLGTGLPTNWTTRTSASASSLGTSQAFTTTEFTWGDTTAAFKNFASATGLSSGASTAQQNDSTDRALGIRPSGSFGEPGASFQYVFTTTGETIDSISFDLMMLSVQGRSTTYTIQYGVGAAPTSFTTLGTWSDPGVWGTTALTFDAGDFGSSLDNQANLVFRVVSLSASTGSGSRDSVAIDNFVINTLGGPTGSGTLGISEAGSATFSGSVAVNSTATFTAAEGGLATFSGVVSGAGSALSKTGAGTVTLSGSTANTFTGTTTVSAGTLELAKTTDTAALAGDVVVASGATLLLSASGNVADTAAVTLSGGTITRGSGVSEVFGNLVVTGSGFLDYGSGDIGTLSFGTYTPSALLTANNFLPGNVLTFGSDLTSSINNVSLFSLGAQGFTSSWNSGTSTFTITAIPEPSTYLAAAGLLSLMLWPSRKRLLKDAKKILGITPPMRDRLAARSKAWDFNRR